MPPVELRPAFAWTCEECGADNVVSGLVRETDQAVGLAVPSTVVCAHCGGTFSARPMTVGGRVV